jgi:hypothetical protein
MRRVSRGGNVAWYTLDNWNAQFAEPWIRDAEDDFKGEERAAVRDELRAAALNPEHAEDDGFLDPSRNSRHGSAAWYN